jgi:molybdopterin-guanine dinucleotide biosynthesis protein A
MTVRQTLCLSIVLIGLALNTLTSHAFAQATGDSAEKTNSGHYLYLEREVEQQIRTIIGTQLKPEQFIIIVEADTKRMDELAKQNDASSSSLPYTTLKVEQSFLKGVLMKSRAKDILSGGLKVRMIFDKSVPVKTQQSLSEKIRKYLVLEGGERALDVSADTIISEPPKDENKSQMEAAKLELEKARLEMERSKLEATQQNSRLEDNLRRAEEDRRKAETDAQKLADDAKRAAEDAKRDAEETKKRVEAELQARLKEIEAEATKKEEKEKFLADKPMLDILKEFQLAMVAVLGVIFAMVGVFLASNFHRKGLKWLSDAVTTVGDGLAKIAAAKTAGDGVNVDATGAAGVGGGVGEMTNSVSIEGATGGADDERAKQFLQIVEQKIEDLSRAGNFNFYRHYIDLIESDVRLAGAVLVSVAPETARKLLTDLAQEYLDKIRDFLAEPGSMELAKKLRDKALQEFYGRISLDEFMDSPLLQVNDVSWLFRLSNAEMRELALELDDRERAAFLACFTPNRLAVMLQESKDDRERNQILQSLKNVDQIASEQVPAMFQRIRQRVEKKRKAVARPMVDGPSFFAKMLLDLKPENRQNFLAALGDRQDIMAGIQRYFIPFDTVARLADSTLKALFEKRSAAQLAVIMYAASEPIRNKVLGIVPQMIKDSVKEQLDLMQSDEGQRKRNMAASLKIQDEISRQMLVLSKQGLLDLAEASAPATQTKAAA